MPPGLRALRRQIARRSGDMGCSLSPDDIIITSGALEAVQLALRATVQPGQVLAVESPTYYGVLECANSLGLEVVEIPTHPQGGMDLDELGRTIRRRKVRACFVMTNGHNPLGYVLSDAYKKALVDLTAKHGVPLIDDDIHGDLTFGEGRPTTTKTFDRSGLVILCSSFSKLLSPGYRVGWIAAGRFAAKIERLKMLASVAVASLPQMVIAEFLESGGYDRHVRQLRSNLANQVDQVRQGVARYFPAGTRVSRPAGGYMLWVELPKRTDAIQLHHAALSRRISVLPGPMCTTTRRYQNFMRLSCGHVWTEAHERALIALGRLCERTR
jgi:DNA-binding transcriptional MocR family regulator